MKSKAPRLTFKHNSWSYLSADKEPYIHVKNQIFPDETNIKYKNINFNIFFHKKLKDIKNCTSSISFIKITNCNYMIN